MVERSSRWGLACDFFRQDLYETFTRQVLPRHPPILHRQNCPIASVRGRGVGGQGVGGVGGVGDCWGLLGIVGDCWGLLGIVGDWRVGLGLGVGGWGLGVGGWGLGVGGWGVGGLGGWEGWEGWVGGFTVKTEARPYHL